MPNHPLSLYHCSNIHFLSLSHFHSVFYGVCERDVCEYMYQCVIVGGMMEAGRALTHGAK